MRREPWMADVEAILARTIGLEPSSLGPAVLSDAIATAFRDSGHTDPAAFVAALSRDDVPRQALIARVVVPESWFLRDGAPFEFLRQEALRWAAANANGVFTVLSAPCATGEEAYSIALTLLDAGLPPARFAVDAVDVSGALIERARRGYYEGTAFRAMPAGLRDRYFVRHERGFLAGDALRTPVTFEARNLTDAAARLPRARYDVVFCRNLLIYLHEDGRRTVLRTLNGVLAPEGVLIVGHAEAVPTCVLGGFSVAHGRAFALRRQGRREAPPPVPLPRRAVEMPRPRAAAAAVRSPAAPSAAPAVLNADLFAHAQQLADRGNLDDARRSVERLLAEQGPSDRAYCLLGIIDAAAGRHREAAEALRRALYLNPSNRDAMLQLAAAYDRQGDRAGADRLRGRAARAAGAAE